MAAPNARRLALTDAASHPAGRHLRPALGRGWRLCILSVLVVALSAGVATQASSQFEDMTEFAVGDTGVELCWGSDGLSSVRSWSLLQQPGLSAPSVVGPPAGTVTGGREALCWTATGLITDTPYTFAIVGHTKSGDLPPETLTAAPRAAGTYVVDGSSSYHRVAAGSPAIAPFGRGELGLVYQGARPDRPKRWAEFFTQRDSAGHWSTPALLSREQLFGPLVFAANRRGDMVVGWNPFGLSKFRYRRAGARRWGPAERIHGNVDLMAAAVDRAGHVHLLLNKQSTGELRYRTNATGRWTETPVPGAEVCNHDDCAPLMTYDPAADRIVVVDYGARPAVADKPAASAAFGRVQRLPKGTRGNGATSVTSYARQITVTFWRSHNFGPAKLYVITGHGPADVTHLTQVPERAGQAGPAPIGLDYAPVRISAAAVTRNRALIVWQHNAFDPAAGLWQQQLVRHTVSGRWTFRPAQQRTTSPYDDLGSIVADAGGQAVIAYTRR